MDLEEGTVSASKVGRPPDPDLATAVAPGPGPFPPHMALALKMWFRKTDVMGTAPGPDCCRSSLEADSGWVVWFGNLPLPKKKVESTAG